MRRASLILKMSVSLDGCVAPPDRSTDLGAGERLFTAPVAIEPISTTTFSAGAVAHVFTAHP